jgi:RHS repeat-associated protein
VAGGNTTTTEYESGIEYDNSTNTVAFIQTEEGRARKSGSNYVYEYDLKDHLGNTRVTLTPDPNDGTQQTAKLLQENDYYAFGYGIQSTQQTISPKNEYLYNNKELQEEIGGLYDYGARFYDPTISRWTSIDPLAEKYSSANPYNYVDNNPIKNIDPDGRDWVISVHSVKGKIQINVTFVGAILNSSGKKIDTKALIANQMKLFSSVFGQGNVHASLMLREVKSADQLKWNESLIEIKKQEEFKDHPDGSFTGGDAALGGKYIRINARAINPDGTLNDQRTIIHEIGHTGGLYHPFDFDSQNQFANDKDAPVEPQRYDNYSENDPDLSANFMDYSHTAAKSHPNYPDAIQYFQRHVGKATSGQIQQIINNLWDGNLNFNNIPKTTPKKQ